MAGANPTQLGACDEFKLRAQVSFRRVTPSGAFGPESCKHAPTAHSGKVPRPALSSGPRRREAGGATSAGELREGVAGTPGGPELTTHLHSFWRGGTSRGLLFRAKDLAPYTQPVRDNIIRTALGSPDPAGRQISGTLKAAAGNTGDLTKTS